MSSDGDGDGDARVRAAMGEDFSCFLIITVFILFLLHVRTVLHDFSRLFDFDFDFIFYFDFTFIARTDSVVRLQRCFDRHYLFIFILIFDLFECASSGDPASTSSDLGASFFFLEGTHERPVRTVHTYVLYVKRR